MPDWPISGGGRVETAGALTSGATAGTTVTANATPNTKGTSFTELIAATSFTARGIIISTETPELDSSLLDIAVGAPTFETIVIPDLLLSANGNVNHMSLAYFPITIPAGSRISAHMASTTGGETAQVVIHLIGGGFSAPAAFSKVTAYGVVTADSGGTQVDPGGTAHTKSSPWTEIEDSTEFPMQGLVIAAGAQANGTMATSQWLVDIGVGSPPEQVIIPNWRLYGNLGEELTPNISPVFPVSIPKGSRLAVRMQCSITDAADRLLDFVLYGIS